MNPAAGGLFAGEVAARDGIGRGSCVISVCSRGFRLLFFDGEAFLVVEGGGDCVEGLAGEAVVDVLLDLPRCLQFGSVHLCFFSFVLAVLFLVLLELAELAAVTSELAAVLLFIAALEHESALTLVNWVRLEYPESLCKSEIVLEDGETVAEVAVSLLSCPRSPDRLTEMLACLRDPATSSPSSEL